MREKKGHSRADIYSMIDALIPARGDLATSQAALALFVNIARRLQISERPTVFLTCVSLSLLHCLLVGNTILCIIVPYQ